MNHQDKGAAPAAKLSDNMTPSMSNNNHDINSANPPFFIDSYGRVLPQEVDIISSEQTELNITTYLINHGNSTTTLIQNTMTSRNIPINESSATSFSALMGGNGSSFGGLGSAPNSPSSSGQDGDIKNDSLELGTDGSSPVASEDISTNQELTSEEEDADDGEEFSLHGPMLGSDIESSSTGGDSENYSDNEDLPDHVSVSEEDDDELPGLVAMSDDEGESSEPEEEYEPAWEPEVQDQAPIEQEEIEEGVLDAVVSHNIDDHSEWILVIFPCGRRFLVKKSVLTKSSAYFRALFREGSDWEEVCEGVLYLQDCDVAVFLVFAQWINTRDVRDLSYILETLVLKIYEIDIGVAGENTEKRIEKDPTGLWAFKKGIDFEPRNCRLDLLIKAWQLGDYFLCPAFQNAVMNEIVGEYQDDGTPLYNLLSIFEKEPSSSPLRQFVFDSVRFRIEPEVYDMVIKMEALPLELIVGLARVSLGRNTELQPDPRDYHIYTCDYHVKPVGVGVCPCPEPKTSSAEHRFDVNGNPW